MHRTLAAYLGIIGIVLAGEGLVRSAAGQPGENFQYGDRSTYTQLEGAYTGVPRDAAAFDYNHDGKKDLVLGLTQAVWAQTSATSSGVPRFVSRTEAFPEELPAVPRGVIIADYNNDSWIDMYVPSLSTTGTIKGHRLYKNESGIFNEVTGSVGADFTNSLYKYTNGGAWGDYDGDGDVDLLLLVGATPTGGDDEGSDSQVLLRNETTAGVTTFAKENEWGLPSLARIRQAFWADFNKDHDLDLVLMQGCEGAPYCNGNSSRYFINAPEPDYHNQFHDTNAEGGFPGGSLLKGEFSMGTVADVNNDGNVELVYLGGGRMGYLVTEPWTSGNPIWAQGEVKLSSGWEQSFTPIGEIPLDITNMDFNLDGRRDFVGAAWDLPVLYKNYDAGSQDYAFPGPQSAITSFGGPANGGNNQGVLAANFVNDGFTDLYFARTSILTPGFAGFFFKTIDPNPDTQPKWIGIRLQASMGSNNYCGIGATVTVTAGSWVQSQVVDGGSGKGTQNDLDLIFGLGDYSGSTVNVQILWPAGQTSVYSGLAVRQLHTLGDYPNVIAGSVTSGLIHHAESNQTDWWFRWSTGPNYDVAMDTIEFDLADMSGSCMPVPEILRSGMSDVTVSVVQTAQGTFEHTLTLSNAGCMAPCKIPFTATSGSGSYVSTSETKFVKMLVCLSNGS